jgi:hypothetical protein
VESGDGAPFSNTPDGERDRIAGGLEMHLFTRPDENPALELWQMFFQLFFKYWARRRRLWHWIPWKSGPKLHFRRRGAEENRELRREMFSNLPLRASPSTSAPLRFNPLFGHFLGDPPTPPMFDFLNALPNQITRASAVISRWARRRLLLGCDD